jgi:anti-sigma factor RsiW
MTISDETLMAFADGELEGPARAAVEAAMREDAGIEQKIAQHRALRRQVQAAYARELSEEIPQRLLAAVQGPAAAPASVPDKGSAAEKARNPVPRPASAPGPATPRSNVVDLRVAREAAARKAGAARVTRIRWRPAASIAASLLIGFGLGYAAWRQTAPPVSRADTGGLVASGALASALSTQLAAKQTPDGAVHIGLSFVAKSGELCRTFVMPGAVSPAGIACRDGRQWQIQLLSQGPQAAAHGDYRTAAAEMPAAILKYVEDDIVGEPLDQSAEAAAQRDGWVRPAH